MFYFTYRWVDADGREVESQQAYQTKPEAVAAKRAQQSFGRFRDKQLGNGVLVKARSKYYDFSRIQVAAN